MASYSDALKFEAEAPANTVRLIKSGEFYRAYNHSAWLFQCCIAEYRVMRKYIKSLKSDVYYIGFPEKSLFSNIGERRSSKTDMGFDIELHEEEVPDDAGFAAGLPLYTWAGDEGKSDGNNHPHIQSHPYKTESQDNSWDAGDAPGSPGVCASYVRP